MYTKHQYIYGLNGDRVKYHQADPMQLIRIFGVVFVISCSFTILVFYSLHSYSQTALPPSSQLLKSFSQPNGLDNLLVCTFGKRMPVYTTRGGYGILTHYVTASDTYYGQFLLHLSSIKWRSFYFKILWIFIHIFRLLQWICYVYYTRRCDFFGEFSSIGRRLGWADISGHLRARKWFWNSYSKHCLSSSLQCWNTPESLFPFCVWRKILRQWRSDA